MMRLATLLGSTTRVAAHRVPAPSAAAAVSLASRRAFSVSPRVLGIVKVPDMAESLTEGTLKQWYKQKGEYVNEGDEIATIETDKVRAPVGCKADRRLTWR